MKSTIFIPKKLNVGFQNRSNTYTGKLAYIIYYDQTNKLRKETSWQSWRDKSIDNEEYENVPTEGFVLNKNVGDCDTGWNHRHAYIRVYDPRGFEFEIKLENLLYILENTNSIKGKGLEGEFVYGWDGKDLILIPTASPDYKEIITYSNKITSMQFIAAKDLKIGATYIDKKNKKFAYIGRFTEHGSTYYITNNVFVFYDLDSTHSDHRYRFEWKKSVAKFLIDCVDEEPIDNYSDIFDSLECTERYSPLDLSKTALVDFTLEQFGKTNIYRYSNYVYSFDFLAFQDEQLCQFKAKPNNEYSVDKSECDSITYTVYKYTYINRHSSFYYSTNIFDANDVVMSNETLENIYNTFKPKYRQFYLVNGREHYKREYCIKSDY